MSSKSSKYGSSSGGGDDPFKNTTPSSMSKRLKEPKKKRGDSKKQEEHNSRRRVQNRNSQRAYRERREQRLMELESQIQQAEALNQTLTTAYQELRAEIDRLEGEKAQEQYYEGFAGQADASFDPASTPANSTMAGYGQGNSTWEDSTWTGQEWGTGSNYNYQG